jgi:hypothetical protein
MPVDTPNGEGGLPSQIQSTHTKYWYGVLDGVIGGAKGTERRTFCLAFSLTT